MVAILADNIFKHVFLNENDRIRIPISLNLFPGVQFIWQKSALVQVMAWRWTGDKPLFEPVLSQFTNTYMQH